MADVAEFLDEHDVFKKNICHVATMMVVYIML